ncbi:hypothetical protein [Streptomyces sp. SID3343]|uniref:hypothetical protein n=1 Tax=Streptomyces sp. SID3343 TaxID=2690260 RepID=UPI001368C7C7|nr:hypothetical protein [Streptomyces sp. SID3343]MYV99806.1 hypothetical protein [Streptomyces sp. SID3343]
MLFTHDVLTGIVSGEVDLVFRRWRRPAVRPGTRVRTAVGVLEVGTVEPVSESNVTEDDAHRAGAASRADLLAYQRQGEDRQLYRIGIRFAGEDPRVELRQDTDLSAADLDAIVAGLARLDAHSSHGPWTTAMLELIAARPAQRAADLAASVGREKPPFKVDVRKLKERGLTESLEVGYRLSPRGRKVLDHLRSRPEA